MGAMRRRLLRLTIVLVVLLAAGWYFATPYLRAASLIVRAANLGGTAEALANRQAARVDIAQPHTMPTRHGDVAGQFYRPEGTSRRTVLLIPGIHSMGIKEPRLTALAEDVAATGITVMAMALPDLQRYSITPRSSDVIEDAVKWMAGQPELARDGKVGIIGISFAGGLSIVAAGRDSIRDHVAFVVSFGGHGDLKRTMRYLTTGQAVDVPGVRVHPPHDYGVAVILYAAADRVVPPDQVAGLREGVETFLLASQLTLVNMDQANATFQKARDMVKTLPEPSATYLTYVNERNVKALGPVLLPHIEQEANNPSASPERAPAPPAAPVFLLHGDDDTVIPAGESVVLGRYLESKDVDVHVLLSGLITHAEVDRSAAMSDTWKLVSFWAGVLQR